MPLVALDGSWCVCMPKKTGSNSLVAMLAPTVAGRDGYDFAEMPGEWHGCQWDGKGKRVMVVRHPLDRWASLYWYAQQEGGPFRGPPGIELWAKQFLEAKTTNHEDSREWWITQSEMADVFHPDVVCRLEDGLERVMEVINMPHKKMYHRNKTEDRQSTETTLAQLSDDSRDAIGAWAAEDLRRWYGGWR